MPDAGNTDAIAGGAEAAVAETTVAETTVAETTVAAGTPLGAQISIVGGNPTGTEVAAVTAVLAAALEELGGQSTAQGAPAESAWQRSQRPLRAPLHPGSGQWRSFSG
jgi:hypothetical protein